jgi:hypothetical protein
LPGEKKKGGNNCSHKSKSSSKKSKKYCNINKDVQDCDRHLNALVSEKKPSRRDRRTSRVRVWRPHLQSISEDYQVLSGSGF